MQALIESIQGAIADGATAEQKAAAAGACRALLAAFETEPGKPMAPPQTPTPLAVLGRLEPDQALDLLIAKLRAAVPTAVQPERARGFKVQLLQVPPGGKP
jgi:hypothetical protein